VKNCEVRKQIVSINFAVAFFALMSKRKKETLNNVKPVHSDVMS